MYPHRTTPNLAVPAPHTPGLPFVQNDARRGLSSRKFHQETRHEVAYSFQQQFAEPILAGTKGGTIRAQRSGRGHARPGEELQLYTGMRTKHCRLICRKPCIAVTRILLGFAPAILPTSTRWPISGPGPTVRRHFSAGTSAGASCPQPNRVSYSRPLVQLSRVTTF